MYLPICSGSEKRLDRFHLLLAALLCYILSESHGNMFLITSDVASSSNSSCTFWTHIRCSHNGRLHHPAKLLQSLDVDRQLHPSTTRTGGLGSPIWSLVISLSFLLIVPQCQPWPATQLRRQSQTEWEQIFLKIIWQCVHHQMVMDPTSSGLCQDARNL